MRSPGSEGRRSSRRRGHSPSARRATAPVPPSDPLSTPERPRKRPLVWLGEAVFGAKGTLRPLRWGRSTDVLPCHIARGTPEGGRGGRESDGPRRLLDERPGTAIGARSGTPTRAPIDAARTPLGTPEDTPRAPQAQRLSQICAQGCAEDTPCAPLRDAANSAFEPNLTH